MQRIVVLNPKGGSGKTTIATNLAAYFAAGGHVPVLMDFDPQGSTTRWVGKRQSNQPKINVIAAYEKDGRMTRAFQLRIPQGTTHVVVDTPAAVPGPEMPDLTRGADKILVPVLPSDIDIHAREILRTRDKLNELLVKHTGQTIDRIKSDTERDYFMSAMESKEYGIIDEVLVQKPGVVATK